MTIARVLERADSLSWDELASSQAIHDYMRELKEQLPQVESLFLVNPQGVVAVSSRAFPMPPYDVTAREYFKAARDGHPGLFISERFRGQMAQTIAFTVTRTRLKAGAFDGLVGVTIFPGYFDAFYRVALRDPLAIAALIRTDGSVLVRYPEPPGLPARVPPES